MRRLKSYDDREQAQGLADALEVRGIESELRSDAEDHAVWVVEESDLEAAAQIAREFVYTGSNEHEAEARRIRKQREAGSRPVRVAGVGGRGLVGSGPPGQVALALIVVCVAVGVLSRFGQVDSPIVRALLIVPIDTNGYYINAIDWSQPWRLLTPMLIHFGLLHLGFNMLWLYRLGSQVENVQGASTLLGLVALTQIPGSLAQFEMTGPLFGGMSGVVYGLFGFTWMQARYGSRGYALNDQDTMWIMGWFVLCATGLVGHIANAQHALGLVFGLLAGMPAYVAFRRSSAATRFEKGSWADLNIRGFQRFRRVWFDPYVPLWFLALAGLVLWWG